jgi:hypothetical protein
MVWQTRVRTPLKNYFVHRDLNEKGLRAKKSPLALVRGAVGNGSSSCDLESGGGEFFCFFN